MKVIVLSEILNNKYRDMILGTAEKVGAEVCFVEREDEIPEDFKDASGSYGVSIAEHIIAVALMMMRRIALLPEGAYVVNVGRGSAIDEDALADSLESGKLGGAALDVFRTEPLPKDSRLWNTKNLIITPHVAGNLTLEYTIKRNVELFCENLICYAEGLPMNQVVDRNRGY